MEWTERTLVNAYVLYFPTSADIPEQRVFNKHLSGVKVMEVTSGLLDVTATLPDKTAPSLMTFRTALSAVLVRI